MNGEAILEYGAVGNSVGNSSQLNWSVNGNSGSSTISPVGTSSTDLYASATGGIKLFNPTSNNLNVVFQFIPGNAEANAWMDFVALNVTRELKMSGNLF